MFLAYYYVGRMFEPNTKLDNNSWISAYKEHTLYLETKIETKEDLDKLDKNQVYFLSKNRNLLFTLFGSRAFLYCKFCGEKKAHWIFRASTSNCDEDSCYFCSDCLEKFSCWLTYMLIKY
jgi:hypothetical protein